MEGGGGVGRKVKSISGFSIESAEKYSKVSRASDLTFIRQRGKRTSENENLQGKQHDKDTQGYDRMCERDTDRE